MILPDVNVLVYAFRPEAAKHAEYASWLSDLVAGADELALHEAPLGGFLRIVTNPRIFEVPAPGPAAAGFVDRLVAAQRGRWLSSSPASWVTFGALIRSDPGVTGNRVPDAHLAACAMTHGCRLATADRGFARYPGLEWFDPAAR